MATATAKLADRIGVASLWTSSNPTLLAGERGVESDTKRFKIGDGSTAWTSLEYASSGEHGAEDTVASATTTDIGATVSENVSITGTTTITGFGTAAAGIKRWGRFTGILTLTHNGTALILPGAANITTAAGDRFVAVSLGSGNWCVHSYTKANGEAVVGGAGGGAGTKTYAVFTIRDWQPPASGFATFDTRNSIGCYDFPPSVASSLFAVSIMPEAASLGSGLIVRIKWKSTSATSGNVRWRVEFENMDSTDLDADSFDTAAEATGAANGTSGIITTTEITITTIDSIVAGSLYRLKITRVGTDAVNDTMTGSAAELDGVEIRSAA